MVGEENFIRCRLKTGERCEAVLVDVAVVASSEGDFAIRPPRRPA